MHPDLQKVYYYWFEQQENKTDKEKNEFWFFKDEQRDWHIKEVFEPILLEFADIPFTPKTAQERLALIVLLDQFPRNIYRGTAQAFAYDKQARTLCKEGLILQDHKKLNAYEQIFFGLPLEHSEDKNDQERSVEYFTLLYKAHPQEYFKVVLDFAIKHKEIIDQFSRYPHRNKALGRATTPQEEEFLKSGPRFGQ